MKKLLALLAVLGAADAAAQTASPVAQSAPPALEITGSITNGVQQIDNSTNSSKLTEYRDLKDSYFLPRVTFAANDRSSGWFVDLAATDAGRDDQSILADGGRPGRWSLRADWRGIPHNFSNQAVTPYIERAPGLFGVPATIPITFKKLATSTAADIPGVLASDDLAAAYQRTYLRATPLATQTNVGRFGGAWTGPDAINVAVAYDVRQKSGFKSVFGPIGDRPPRTLNVQLTEPVDYRTNELTVAAEHQGAAFQMRGEYLFSDFANRIDTLQWQNVWTTPAAGATFDAWDRSVSAYGVRPLPPDNRYHNATVTLGRDLPRDSRLMASASYGRVEQNETLLPYSYNLDQVVNRTLPRATAEALIGTTNVTADYVISPVQRLNVRGFFRRYDLDNQTPSSRWQYVTSDTSNINGTVSYTNKRVSIPYEFTRQNAGVDATLRLPGRSSVAFGYELEDVERLHREGDTAEQIVRVTWRGRPARWASLEARFLGGVRDGGVYDNAVTREGYWYAPSEANDNNNPALTFDNHPDMRRFDVSDRLRRQFEFRVNVTSRDVAAISAYVRYRNDDFDSDVAPSQPLLGTVLADANATTPGDQLGLLEDRRTRYGLDAFVQSSPRVSVNAFMNFDKGSALNRSIEFNENNKANPGAVATAELGPWTRAASQWTADIDDRTWGAGAGTTLELVPRRLTLIADYTLSLATVDIAYGGFGVTNYDGTPFLANQQFAFSSPPSIREDLHVANLRFEIPVRVVTVIASYTYENYSLQDWQQESTTPWVEAVGADTLLRDSSRSYQWGNRLFNLGTYLAPSYSAHVGFVGFRYRF